MAGALALVAAIAALDSLNPSTVGPALILAATGHGRQKVAAFTAGVFVTSTAGGFLLLLVLGRTVLLSLAKPRPHTQHVVEAATGAALLLLAGGLWLARSRIWPTTPGGDVSRRRPVLLGAVIMGVELPTAFPYFAALAAIVEATRSVADEALLILLYNVLFVAPLVAILVLSGFISSEITKTVAAAMSRFARRVIPAGVALVGVGLLAFAATRL